MARLDVAPRATRVPDIRKGDQIVVLAGKDAGKHGTVDHVVRNRQAFRKVAGKFTAGWRRSSPLADVAVVVEGLNIAKKHTKPQQKAGRTDRQPRIQQGGILEVAKPIPVSKVMIVCPHCNRPTRVRHGVAADGRSVRLCHNCGEMLTVEARKP